MTPYEYRVKITSVPLWQQVTKLQQGTDPALDSDFTQFDRGVYNTAVSEPRVLGELGGAEQLLPIETFAGTPAEHVDLGLTPLETRATLGDYIWFDQNGDGIQGAGEEGVEGLPIVLNRLVADELVPVAETVTAADGRYEFTVDVADTNPESARFNQPHEYVIEFNMTSRQSLSPLKAGADEALDSNFVKLGDADSQGYVHSIADPEHTAIAGPVTLVQIDGRGYARFDTSANVADVDGGVIVHDTVRILGDTLFEDLNRDGKQSAGEAGIGEPGIGGLTVKLFRLNQDTGAWEPHTDSDGNSSVVSDAEGRYQFAVEVADLDKASPHYRQAEQYRVLVEAPAHMRLVEVDNVLFYAGDLVNDEGTPNYTGIDIAKPFSYVLSEATTLVDSADSADSADSSGSAGSAAGGVVLTSARDVLTVDGGFAVYDTSVTIGGMAWQDSDLDGLQGAEELGLPGRAVTLWELVGGDWTPVDDVNGIGVQKTDEAGRYSFEVSPTHYAEDEANFLQPREYRVSVEREGFESWSPLNVGDDAAVDSDVAVSESGFGSVHTGVTRVFSIVDVEDGRVDVATVRDDVEMDVGVKVHDRLALIGGVVWDDADEDGEQQRGERAMVGQEVTLWERVDGEWTITEDNRGNATQITDAEGHYEFEVLATDYDVTSDRYLQPREYRTTVQTPEGCALSEGSMTVVLDEDRAVTQSAQIAALDEAGIVDVKNIYDDLTLSYPFAQVPEAQAPGAQVPGDSWLAITGADFKLGLGVLGGLGVLLGLAAIYLSARRQREKNVG